MAIKVKAQERNISFTKGEEKYAYVMQAEIYNRLTADKVIEEAAIRTGLPKPVIRAAYSGISHVVSAWATEGHSVAIPGLGTMRFSLRSTSVSDVNLVGTDLITSRRVVFTPSSDIRKQLIDTSINITCYDRYGNIVKRVTSVDDGNVEDNESPDNPSNGNNTGGGSDHTGGGSDNTGSGSSGDGGME